jgi:hypothetical protein
MSDTNFTALCPNCNTWILIEQINCAIFRHGVNRFTGMQMPPHLEKEHCDKLIEMGVLFGCGKPFRLVPNPKYDPTRTVIGPKDEENPKWVAEACDYI